MLAGNLNKIIFPSEIYRKKVKNKCSFSFRFLYKYSDIYISVDFKRDVKIDYESLEKTLKNFIEQIYQKIEFVIVKDNLFKGSLLPVKIKSFYPEEIKKMCNSSSIFGVGPMAAVAGAVNDYIAENLIKSFPDVKKLIIENGGDTFIKSDEDLNVGVYTTNNFFKDKIILNISKENLPCGLCSSSGTVGRSLSLGQCDLAIVMAETSSIADAAATAVANSVKNEDDIGKSVNYFSKFKQIKGLLIIKDKKIGLWGNFKLVSNYEMH